MNNLHKLLIVLGLTLFIGCEGVDQIKTWGENGQSEKLIKYVTNNKNNTTKKSLVDLAIDEICNNNLESGINYLKSEFVSKLSSSYWMPTPEKQYLLSILTNFNRYNLSFHSLGNVDSLGSLFIDKLASSVQKKDTLFTKQYKDYIEKNHNESLEIIFINKIKMLDNSNKLDETIKIINAVNILNLDFTNDIDLLLKNFISKQNLEKELSEIRVSYNANKESIKELDEYISKNNVFTLSGYIIGVTDKGTIAGDPYEVYEITPFYSSQHAFLYTFETSYSSKGRFTLDVITSSKTPVNLKEEYGGFKQEWDTYMEATADIKESISKKTLLLELKNILLISNKQKMDSISVELNGINHALYSIYSSINLKNNDELVEKCSTVESVATLVFECLKTNEFDKMISLVPNIDFYEHLLTINPTNEEINLKDIYIEAKNRLKTEFGEAIAGGKSIGINWADIKYISYTIEKGRQKDYGRLDDITILFKCENRTYSIELDDCYQFNDIWLMKDGTKKPIQIN